MIEFLIWLVICFISTLGFAYVYYKFTDMEKIFDKKSFAIFIIGVIFATFVQYYKIEFVGHISFFVFYPILFYFMNPLPFKKIIYYVIVIWLYGTILDLFAMLIVSIFHTFLEFDVYSHYFESVLTFFVFLMLVLLGNSKKLKKFTDNLYKKINRIDYLDFSIITFSLCMLALSISIFSNLHNLKFDLLIILVIMLISIDFIILIKYKINGNENKIFLKTLKENNDFYIKVEDENCIFKHNLTAKLLSIKSVSNKKATLLIDDLLSQYNENIDFSNHMKAIPYGLNGILYQKVYSYLKDLNIKIYNEIDYDIFNVLQPRRYNVFVEKMVLALDNAIEASLKSNEKLLVINLYDENNTPIIEIKNTFSNAIDIDQLGTKNYSSKGKKRGIGLFSSFRDNEAILTVSIINDMFVSKITTKKRLNS